MISVTEVISSLQKREDQLHQSLDNLRGQKSKVKEHKQLDKELAALIRKRQNLESLTRFEIGMPVNRADVRCLGRVTEIVINPGGLGQVWVSWDEKVQIPEQPDLLKPDTEAIAQIIRVGDRIVIGNGHEDSGKMFTVARILARGWVESTDESIFPREYWTKVESPVVTLAQEQEEPIDSDDGTLTNTPERNMVEESPEEELELLPESVVIVETLATHEEIEELTEDEEQERHRLELKVERAFTEAGIALRELRDKRLYRSTHSTFEAYCRDRFGFQRRHCYRLIEAAEVVDNLQEFCVQFGHILPAKESICRSLTSFPPDGQRKAWQQILEETGGRQPTGKEVKGIVERMKEKPLNLASDYCSVGDVFTLVRLEGVERKYNGCWAIATELRNFTVVVDVHDTTLTVKSENLQPIDSPDARRQLPQTLKRIRRLRSVGLLDRGACIMLDHLGRQIYLTDVEEGLLQWLENHYSIDS